MRWLWTVGAVLAFGAWSVAAAGADGEAVYAQQCAACHQATGEGVPGVFPPLKDNPRLADRAYLARVIQEGLSGPIEVNGQTYTGAMPPFANLGGAELEALLDYLQVRFGTASAPEAPSPASTLPEGDAARGRALFLGSARFTNGGAACVACHTAGQVGALGGGALGPDLSALYRRFGEAGLSSALKTPAFRVMRETYRDKPLTDAEVADLIAFFKAVDGAEPAPQAGLARLWQLGLLGMGLLLAAMYAFWPRQRESLAERLRRRA
ncbi:c-type cytochrome [Marinithermus hydrothermalis]|uniref:Cytochrome c class I n=1 Tax=Marinithermus hydrothermalis (strain DSM 14884 / JCM 11576 / T1) TaxID=869210 RepID=F2NR02_MARHT|nr:c-type cytochrome [Marinithermus hydrothermalis]AEB12580.1 cytochrome c class I [Marinithermus hydrothermalis DSM 14884]